MLIVMRSNDGWLWQCRTGSKFTESSATTFRTQAEAKTDVETRFHRPYPEGREI